MALTKISGNVIKDSVSLAGNVSIGGTLTYQDVTNIDAVGLITARTGIKVLGGGINAVGVVTSTTFSGSGASLTSIPAGQLTGTVADARISTLTASKLTGALPAISGANLTGITVPGGGTGLDLNDNVKIALGSGTDLLIYHDGSNSLIRSGGTGQLQIESSNNTSIVMGNAGLSETIFKGSVNGTVELYNDNVKVIETNTTGIQVGFDAAVSNPTIKLPDNGYLTWGTSDTAYIQGADAGSGGYLKFNANNGQRATIDGDGLKFGSDTAAANALDDYEEGSYTPVLSYVSSDDGNKVYQHRYGVYTKIGRAVHVSLIIQLTNRGTGAGEMRVSLPFNVPDILSGTSLESQGTVAYFDNLSSSVSSIGVSPIAGTNQFRFDSVKGQYNTTTSPLAQNEIGNNFSIRCFVTYFVT